MKICSHLINDHAAAAAARETHSRLNDEISVLYLNSDFVLDVDEDQNFVFCSAIT